MSVHFTQLFALLFQEGKTEQLRKAVDQAKDRMRAAGEEDLWRYWYCLASAAGGDFEAANREAALLSDFRRDEAMRAVLLEEARQTQSYSRAIEFFSARWRETQRASDLLLLCELYAQAGDPQFVVDHSEELIQGVRTSAALRLAISAAVRVEAWETCLALLSSHTDLFPDSQLPPDLRRLRVSCAQAVGRLEEARKGAEALVHEEASIDNLSLLFRVHVQAGNLKEARFAARELVHTSDAAPELLVEVARVMRLEDPSVASEALRRAVERGLSGPEPVSLATTIAFQLNLESLQPILLRKMAEEAQRGTPSLKAANFHELVEMKRIAGEQTRQAIEEWRSGRVPVHTLRHAINIPLAAWPVLALADVRPGGVMSAQLPVFFRHGGRPATPAPRDIKRLYVDITALHLAFELGILPLVESTYGPLYLPPAARTSLVTQADDAKRNQPNVIAARRAVSALLESTEISIWNAPELSHGRTELQEGLDAEWWSALDAMQQQGGLLVDYWPKLRRNGEPFQPDEKIATSVTSMAQIVRALMEAGFLEQDQAERAMERVRGSSSAQVELPLPSPGQTLLLEGNIAEQLAEAGVLEAAARTFKILLPQQDVLFLRSELARERHWEQLSKHLEDIRAHVTGSEHYAELLTHGKIPVQAQGIPLDPAEVCIMQLLDATPGDGHFAWIDDRCLNAHGRCGEVPIITTLGLIEELHRSGKLATTKYHALRHRLRVADFRYVPLTSDEVVHHLAHARVSNGQVIETPELAVLRRYHARTILDHQALQIPPLESNAPNQAGESNLLVSTVVAAGESLTAIFANDQNDRSTKFALADWVLQQLWLEPAHFRRILERSKPDKAAFAALSGIGDMMLLTRAISTSALGGSDNRNLYFEWLGFRMLVDRHRITTAARNVANLIEKKVQPEPSNEEERRAFVAVIQGWYLALPEAVRQQTSLKARTREELFLGRKRVITLGDIQFDQTEFWQAVASSFGGVSTVRALGEGPTFTVTISVENGVPRLLLESDATTQRFSVDDPVIRVLNGDADERLRALRANPEWFDGFGSDAAREMDRVAKMTEAPARAEAVEEARIVSAWQNYLNLAKKCLSREGPTLDDMAPPEPSSLTSFLRIPKSFGAKDARSVFEDASTTLLAEVGLEEAFTRVATLPIAVPASLVAAFRKLDEAGQISLAERLEENIHNPIVRVHYLALLSHAGQACSEKATTALRALADPAQIAETRALLRSVSWAWKQFGLTYDVRPPLRLALAWLHGGMLFTLLRQIGPASQIEDFVRANEKNVPGETIASAAGDADVASPRHIAPAVLLISGIGAALESASHDRNPIVDDASAKLLREACFMEYAGAQVPKPEWLNDPTERDNVLGSFLGDDRALHLAALFGAETASEFSAERSRRELESVITSLEENHRHEPPWVLLVALLTNQPCPRAFRKRLRKLLARVSWDLFEGQENVRGAIFALCAAQAGSLGGEQLIHTFQQRIADCAHALASIAGDQRIKPERLNNVLVPVEALARHAGAAASARIFAETIVMCFNQWPALVDALPGAILQLMLLPEQQMKDTWPLILRLRHDAQPRRDTSAVKAISA